MNYDPNNVCLAKNLRSQMTKEEVKLWNILRGHRFFNKKFKRQVPIGEYIVDFLCKDNKLIIELDGSQHNEEVNRKNDLKKTEYLEKQGYRVLRFWNNEVWNNIEGVCEVIKKELGL